MRMVGWARRAPVQKLLPKRYKIICGPVNIGRRSCTGALLAHLSHSSIRLHAEHCNTSIDITQLAVWLLVVLTRLFINPDKQTETNIECSPQFFPVVHSCLVIISYFQVFYISWITCTCVPLCQMIFQLKMGSTQNVLFYYIEHLECLYFSHKLRKTPTIQWINFIHIHSPQWILVW